MSNLLLEDSNEKCPLDEYSNDHRLEWDFPSYESTDQCSQSSCSNHALFFVRFHVVCQKSAPVCSSKSPFRVFSSDILHFELKSPFQVFGLSSSFCSFFSFYFFFNSFFIFLSPFQRYSSPCSTCPSWVGYEIFGNLQPFAPMNQRDIL